MSTVLDEPEPLAAEHDLRRDLRIEGLLREWNLEFTFEAEFPLTKLDANYDEAQVRRSEHRAPRENVEEYATQMRAGAVFPPLVATHNRRLIDGNTRKGAAERNNTETFPTYLVRLPNASYGPMIGAALNQMGGKRLTNEEAYAAAETMFRNGIGDEAIARTIGKSPSSIRAYRKQARYKEAAERTGVTEVAIPATSQRALAGISLDAPFKEAVQLASVAKLPPKDVEEMVAKIEDTRSEAQALEVIQEVRAKHGPKGPPPIKRAATKAATAAGRQVDGFLAKVTAPPGELAPASLRGELEPKWRKLQELAGSVLLAFAENPPEPETAAETPPATA